MYVITCSVDGKQYVGQTTCGAQERWKGHRSEARNGGGYLLSRAIRKHGVENFDLKVVGTASAQEGLDCLEGLWMERLRTRSPNGYNLREAGSKGKMAPETKEKLSKSHTGKKMPREGVEKSRLAQIGRKDSEETRRKKSLSSLGQIHTPETRAKIAASNRGKVATPEHREKNRVAHLRENWSPEGLEKCRQAGLNISDENREKLRQRRLGATASPDSKQKTSEGMRAAWGRGDFDLHKGRKASEETRRKMREAHKNRAPVSEETRQRIREAALARWRKQKEIAKG